MSDAAGAGARRRSRGAVVLLLVGLVVAFVPGVASSEGFVRVIRVSCRPHDSSTWHEEWMDVRDGHWFDRLERLPNGTSAFRLVGSDVAWAFVAASLMLVPVLWVWWRRANFRIARSAGIACAVAASASVVALVMSMRLSHVPEGLWWTVPAGGALMAAAFVVAPPPRASDG